MVANVSHIRAEITFFYFSFLYFTSKISNPPVLFDGELLQINDKVENFLSKDLWTVSVEHFS